MSRKLSTGEFIVRVTKIHGNKYDYSKVNYINNRIKVTIVCPIHGEFLSAPYHHLSGQGCCECGGSKRWDKNTFVNAARKVHGNRYCYDESVYINGITPLKIICKIHGELYKNTFMKFEKLKSLGYTIKYIWESDWNCYDTTKEIPIKEYK